MRKYWHDELRVSIAVPYTDCMGKKYWLDREVLITTEDIWYSNDNWIAEIGNVRYKGKISVDNGQQTPTTYHVTAQCIDRHSERFNHFYTLKIISAE